VHKDNIFQHAMITVQILLFVSKKELQTEINN
jgi:hypothetical protein